MKDIEPLYDLDEAKTPEKDGLEPWGLVSNSLNRLGLHKGAFRVFCYILCRAGEKGVCYAAVGTIARETHTHPVYVRHLVRYLVRKKLILRHCRAGRTNAWKVTPKWEWIKAHGYKVADVSTRYEESAGEVVMHVLWARIWETIPNAPKALFEKRIKQHPELFERCLCEVEERTRRGHDPRQVHDRLSKLNSPLKWFNYWWAQLIQKNQQDKGK